MIEQLRIAGDQLRTAWDNYFRVYSRLEYDYPGKKTSSGYSFPLEIARQLETELAFISSYEPKIQEIKVTIGSTRNYCCGLAPINTLPPEILARIFYLSLPPSCDIHLISSGNAHYSRYPDHLGQVCALWRRVAISTQALWCHIDLSDIRPYSEGLVTRASIHAARAGKLPIELHIFTNDDYSFECNNRYLFLPHISRRVETLELRMAGPFREFHSGLFKLLLQKHPILDKLALSSESSYYNNFLVSNSYDTIDWGRDSWPLIIDCSEDDIENSFSSLSVLHLRGIFPLWNSTAYHGLVDLRLLSTPNWSHIGEAELITILRSSPGLRILHFGLQIDDPIAGDEGVTPLPLKDLQVVHIFVEDHEEMRLHPDSILRLLAPGRELLQLCISGFYTPGTDSVTELEKFIFRSRLSHFYSRYNFPPLSLLLHQAGDIQRIVLKDLGYQNRVELPATWMQIKQFASLPRLTSIDIIDSALLQSDVRLLYECCPSGITLQSSRVVEVDLEADIEFILLSPDELVETFPGISLEENDRIYCDDSTLGWDEWIGIA
ncbi:F-box-like domain-containing protein [Rhizoctonia solani AG-1 IA]|uniref:F-box-like protein n=3 Tax=Rhizoctonia solani TaxID=456999 RepID=A0A8H8P4U2_9AGAM|nr:F-box-like protein [Rhizoctonia solani]ELU38907.1 F-box-like domain-containing protein [Rhizoctonia solani AG-1 IA]QRW23843.1 F-box-like protein [Rhizoctonia solani]